MTTRDLAERNGVGMPIKPTCGLLAEKEGLQNTSIYFALRAPVGREKLLQAIFSNPRGFSPSASVNKKVPQGAFVIGGVHSQHPSSIFFLFPCNTGKYRDFPHVFALLFFMPPLTL